MLVTKTDPLPVECVARGYLSGSGWKDYQRTGAVCGHALPAGLRESDRLPRPVFTPATKAESGHDENISEAQAGDIVGQALARRPLGTTSPTKRPNRTPLMAASNLDAAMLEPKRT